MYCKNCGEKIKEKAKFCIFCGTQVDYIEDVLAEKKEEIINEDITDIFEKDEVEEKNDFKNLDEMESLENSEDIEQSEGLREEFSEVSIETEKLPEELCDLEKTENNCEEVPENEEELIEETLMEEKKQEVLKNEKQLVGEEIISLVFGFTSLILAVFINIFALPMSVSGLVFGGYGKAKSGKKTSVGRCINIASIIISLFMFFVCVCGFLGMMSSIQTDLIMPERFDYQYNLNTRINDEEDKQAEENWQKAQDMLNKQVENKRKLEETKVSEDKKEEEKEITETSGSKYTNIGFMEYTIPDTWKFNGIRESGGNSVANVFSKNEDTAFLAIKAMDLTNAQFNKEMLATEVTQMYGGVSEQGSFTTNNGITWDYIKTPVYDGENIKYFNNIYYHLTDDEKALLYFEIYIPDNGTVEELMKDIDTILNSVKKHK